MEKITLKDILSIPTYFGYESRIIEYIVNFAIDNKLRYEIDGKGNIYIIKGELNEGEYYPCVAAHLDTVFKSQIELISENKRLNIIETTTGDDIILRAENNGIGGDDKCGVAICLELLLENDKLIASFFVEEEFGCFGSRVADKDIFKNIGYVIQFDAPGNNWCSEYCAGVKLYNDEVLSEIKPILDKYGIDNFSNDPYTDVVMLRINNDIVCLNFYAGYYNQHSIREYVSLNDVNKAISMGNEILNKLGNVNKYFSRHV